MVLDDNISINTYGGKVNYAWLSVIGAAITFVVGVIDGYLRPLSCNK